MQKGDAVRANNALWMLTTDAKCGCCQEWESAKDTVYGVWFFELESAPDFKWIVKDGEFCE